MTCDPDFQETAAAWQQYYYQFDTGFTGLRRARRLKVFDLHDLYDATALTKTEIYNDWLVPYRCANTLAMAVDFDDALPAASIHCYGARQKPDLSESGRPLLEVAWPAFEVGVRAAVRFSGQRARLAPFFDASPDGVLLMDFCGRVIHRTPQLERALASDPERQQVDGAMKQAILALAPAARRKTALNAPGDEPVRFTIRTVSRSYQIRVTTFAGTFGFDDAVGVVWVELPPRRQLADNELSDLFGLTRREADVARHVAAGCSNGEVAASLGISVHTERRHVERVLQKLQVRTRASVGPKLQGDA